MSFQTKQILHAKLVAKPPTFGCLLSTFGKVYLVRSFCIYPRSSRFSMSAVGEPAFGDAWTRRLQRQLASDERRIAELARQVSAGA